MKALCCSALLLALAGPSIAPAGEGALEINQACAEGPGCFPDDDPGFPVRILNSGSYVLTSNLTVPQEVDAITTQRTDAGFPDILDIAIDLNGFTISSNTRCTELPLVCSPVSFTSGYGIRLLASEDGVFLVHGGVVKNMAVTGINCAGNGICTIEDVVATQNAVSGIGVRGSVRNAQAIRNGFDGIGASDSSVVENCVARENADNGFSGTGTFVNNVTEDNEGHGFYGLAGAVFVANQSSGDDVGIRCNQCAAHNNVIYSADTTGIDFAGTAGIYGGNRINAGTQALLNAESAVQSAPNVCTPLACP